MKAFLNLYYTEYDTGYKATYLPSGETIILIKTKGLTQEDIKNLDGNPLKIEIIRKSDRWKFLEL